MVSIIMGSDSDLPIVKKTIEVLKELEIDHDVKIISAHRAPNMLREYILEAEASGRKVFVGVAGKAAHLPGVIASYTTLPVIGLPIKTPDLGGIDSLLSIAQMPPGIPVATVAIDGGRNAGILAAQILCTSSDEIKHKLKVLRDKMEEEIREKNLKLKETLD